MDHTRPRLILHQVATADGRVALSPRVLLMGDPRWPTFADSGYADVLRRHHPGALLEGSGSFVLPEAGAIAPGAEASGTTGQAPTAGDADVAAAAQHPDHFLPSEVLARTTRWFTIVDSRGRVAWQFKEFPGPEWAGTHLLVLVSRATPSHYLAFLRAATIPYLVVGEQGVDLTEALTALRTVLGVTTVVATGGARLGGALLRAGLVDQIEIEIVPILAGGEHTPTMLTCPDLGPDEPPVALHLEGVEAKDDGRVLVRYTTAPQA